MANAIQALMQVPLPELVQRLGRSIAEAQMAMDRNSAEMCQMMSGTKTDGKPDDANLIQFRNGKRLSMLELGFTPSFYHLTEAKIEVKVTFTTAESTKISIGASVGVDVPLEIVVFSASVDASYTNKYSFDAFGSSSINASFVAVPPPARLADKLQDLQRDQQRKKAAATAIPPEIVKET